MPSKYDWGAIRALYEAGESPAHIAKLDGMPSKQAIHQQAKRHDWTAIDKIDQRFEIIPFDGLDDRQRIVVAELAKGATEAIAGAIAGVSRQTVIRWRKDETFNRACLAAEGMVAREQLAKVTESTDWRSGTWYLERAKLTREEMKPPQQQPQGPSGNVFNVLGHVSVGIERDPNLGVSEDREQPAIAAPGRNGHESHG